MGRACAMCFVFLACGSVGGSEERWVSRVVAYVSVEGLVSQRYCVCRQGG